MKQLQIYSSTKNGRAVMLGDKRCDFRSKKNENRQVLKNEQYYLIKYVRIHASVNILTILNTSIDDKPIPESINAT